MGCGGGRSKTVCKHSTAETQIICKAVKIAYLTAYRTVFRKGVKPHPPPLTIHRMGGSKENRV